MDEQTTFLVVGGCGTIGLSTAWHLARRGYRNITCLDRWPYPSRSSAGFDLNKIVRTEYAEPMYSKLAQEAIELWQDPLFADVFHKTGWIAGTTSPRPDPARPRQSPPPGTLNVRSVEPSLSPFLVDSFDRAVENTFKYGDPSGITKLESREELRASEWGKYFSGMEDYRGIHNSNAGWVAAAEALAVVGKECKRLGVEFVHGVMTEVVKGDGGKVVGVVTEDGKTLKADKVVLALGAYTDSVLDMEGQTLGVAYSITHVRMTDKEREFYGGMPVIDIEGYGYTFPPRDDGVIKFCDLHPGHPWRQRLPGRSEPVSVPRDWAYHGHDQLSIEDRESVRRFIGYCMPEFKDRPFEFSRMCWDLESFDYHWIITEHPSSPDSLFLATAGSGHTFKNLPNVGKYVVDCLEGKLSPEHKEAWRWRPDRIGTVPPVKRVDLQDLHGWKGDDANGEPSAQCKT